MNTQLSLRPAAVTTAFISMWLFSGPVPALASLAERPASSLPESSASRAIPIVRPLTAAPIPVPGPGLPSPIVPESAMAQDTSVPGKEEIIAAARKGLLDSALRLCRRALAADSGNPFLLLMMGKLSPDGKSSSEYFKSAIRWGGTSPEAEESIFRLGQFNYAAGKYYLAIPFFRDYLRQYPSGDWNEPAHYWMGNACLSLAQARPDRIAYLDSGAAYFTRLLEKQSPEQYYHTLALEGSAKVKAAKGDRQGAWEDARMALEGAPQEERAALLLLSAQIRQGADREEEKRLMASLIASYPQSPEARYLRKINAGSDTARWKSGSGPSRAVPQPGKDSLTSFRFADSLGRTSQTPAPAMGGQPGSPGAFTLQVGAFSQTANAKAMLANLAKLGFAPEMVEIRRGGKPIYQIRLGRFGSVEEASEYAQKNLKPHRLLSQPIQLTP